MVDARNDQWPGITASDEEIAAALQEADIPSLMTALVHITGDPGIIRGSIRPDAGFFGAPQGGIPEDQQQQIREQALQVLIAWRDGDGKLPPKPAGNVIREMMNFIVGEDLPDEYIGFLESELAMNGEDAYAQPAIEAVSGEKRAAFPVLIIGSGMSGILAGIRLRQAGIPFTIIEKNPNVGGTWFQNTYPGCRVDSPNHNYSYSFAQQDWPQHYSPQKVLLSYFDQVATEYGIREHVRFNTEVKKAEYDEASGHWRLYVVTDGQTESVLEGRALITAVGQLNRPRMPVIDGMETFDGPAFHSGEWEHEHDLTGKRIGVVGTGASAFQFVPEIARKAGDVVVFQRTPPWIAPREEYHDDIPEGKHWLLNNVPFYAKWYRFLMFWRTSEGLLGSVKKDDNWQDEISVSAANEELRQMLTEYIRSMVGDDPDLFAKAVPNYPPAGKRMLVDNGTWLTTLKRDNVHIITDEITAINERGLRTDTGDQYDVDVIIYATGFHANKFLWPMEIKGLNGADLQEYWDGDPRAYLGITIPGFPNLFCMYGPNTNIVVNGSIIFFSECEMRYILGCLALVIDKDLKALDCKPEIHDAYNEMIDAGNLKMAWGAPNVRSWYKNEKGRVTQNWPFTLREYWERTQAPDPSDYELIKAG
ncbi:MAG: NAD(P)/FAD-dependent oxidoreductase [Pseudomonadales bacterium]|nr:NAD(P)/FAD-dependent oxidoreductase [Pseudomonadales bacterium]